MLVIEKYIDKIKKIDTDDCVDCELNKILLNTDEQECSLDNCEKCLKNSLIKLAQEYKEPIKLSRLEYDILKSVPCKDHCNFYDFDLLKNLKQKGHFKGVKDELMTIEKILENCKVVD